MSKTIFFFLLFLIYFPSFSLALIIFYHFQRFKPLIDFERKKLLILLMAGLISFLFLSLFFLFLF